MPLMSGCCFFARRTAWATGVGVIYISHIETGNSIPGLQITVDIVNALGCSAVRGCGIGRVCAGQLAGGADGRLQRRGGQADQRLGACAESLPAANIFGIVALYAGQAGLAPAREVYRSIRGQIVRLRDFPPLGPLHPDPELAVLGNWRLVLTKTDAAAYRVIDDTMLTYRVVNGKTDYPKVLK